MNKKFSFDEAEAVGKELGISWESFEIEQFLEGLNVELEHGTINPETNITNDDITMTGKIVIAHLNQYSDYYTRLESMKREADEYWQERREK